MKLMRDVPGYPELRIDSEGVVWQMGKRVITTNVDSKHGIRMLAIVHGEDLVPVWRLVASAYYEDQLVLPRDGNFMRFQVSNLVEVKQLSSRAIIDIEEIQLIWWMYCRGLRCAEIREEAKWGNKYKVEDIKSVVRDILTQGIR
jgi:hypothetical protein